jgi:hypothetical protein
MTQELATLDDALSRRGIQPEMWAALTNSVFPGAKEESIFLAVDYCKARNLDVMKKPVHIVGMMVTDAKTNNSSWRDVIMPGIYELRMTAFRTQEYAGIDREEFTICTQAVHRVGCSIEDLLIEL